MTPFDWHRRKQSLEALGTVESLDQPRKGHHILLTDCIFAQTLFDEAARKNPPLLRLRSISGGLLDPKAQYKVCLADMKAKKYKIP